MRAMRIFVAGILLAVAISVSAYPSNAGDSCGSSEALKCKIEKLGKAIDSADCSRSVPDPQWAKMKGEQSAFEFLRLQQRSLGNAGFVVWLKCQKFSVSLAIDRQNGCTDCEFYIFAFFNRAKLDPYPRNWFAELIGWGQWQHFVIAVNAHDEITNVDVADSL